MLYGISNDVLGRVMDANRRVGAPAWTAEEKSFAETEDARGPQTFRC
jgi:hypothetical protein